MYNMEQTNDDVVSGFDNNKDSNLKIRLSLVEGCPKIIIVTLKGYIDTYNSDFFQKQVNRAIRSGYNKIIFDLSDINYISSTGIGSFTFFLKEVNSSNGNVVLIYIQPKVYEVFQLLGFSKFFNIKESIEESIDFLSRKGVKEAPSIFPKIIACPICSKRLKASKSGRFKCPNCKTIIAIDTFGQIFLA